MCPLIPVVRDSPTLPARPVGGLSSARSPASRLSAIQQQVTLIITTKLLLIQSDLVSLSLTIALPKALGSASARGEFSPSTRASPPLVSIANHAGVGSLQGEA